VIRRRRMLTIGTQALSDAAIHPAASFACHSPPRCYCPRLGLAQVRPRFSHSHLTPVGLFFSSARKHYQILCKGKVVYPSKDLTDEQASSQLLEISRRAMMVSSSSSASPGHRSFLHPGSKVPLLVMGTERGHELALKRRPPSPERPSPAGGGGGTLAGWARAAWDLAGTLGSAAFHLALSLAARSLGFVRSLLLPPQPPGTAAS
jgi:hypothetical protein